MSLKVIYLEKLITLCILKKGVGKSGNNLQLRNV